MQKTETVIQPFMLDALEAVPGVTTFTVAEVAPTASPLPGCGCGMPAILGRVSSSGASP